MKFSFLQLICIVNSPSLDCTNKVLSVQLKTECGSQFTNKLEGMFKVCDFLNHTKYIFKISD